MEMNTGMDIDMDDLVNAFNHKTSVEWTPNYKFVKDIDILIQELRAYHSFIELDIYEVLVTCGHDLTWDQEYYVTEKDVKWFRHEQGRTYFISEIMQDNNIINNTIVEWDALIQIHNCLAELFELQIENID